MKQYTIQVHWKDGFVENLGRWISYYSCKKDCVNLQKVFKDDWKDALVTIKSFEC